MKQSDVICRRLNFKCSLLTDIVISAQTATEGEHRSLNFIPGSNFLGILASELYNNTENETQNYDIFHSGKVRFGDAHILYNNQRSFQVPFSWFYPKGGKLTGDEIFMSDFMKSESRTHLIDEGIVLKQARDGYFTSEGIFLSPKKIYTQKSGYDSEQRRSRENAMFGYEALTEGSDWQFAVDIDNVDISNDIIDLIKKNLTGEKLLGRSKTAEFGRVVIKFIDSVDVKSSIIIPKHQFLFLYAESRLVFRDKETGQPTYTPAPEDLGMPLGANILWERSQIRTGMYAPWNGKRNSRDEDRVFIEKGSVFTVEVTDAQEYSTEGIVKGVGYYRTEGFGKLLVDPDFLDFDQETGKLTLSLKYPPPDDKNEVAAPETLLIKWIKQQELKQHSDKDGVLREVDNFIHDYGDKFSNVTKSQWGSVRSRATQAKDADVLMKNLFARPDQDEQTTGGDLYHGVSENQWTEGRDIFEERIKTLVQQKVNVLLFVEKLAARMQKKGGDQ